MLGCHMDKKFHISITAGTVVTTLLVIAGAYAFWLLRGLALLVLAAIVIASAIEPGVAFFIRCRMPRFVAALLMYVLVFGSVFSLIYFFFPPIIADSCQFLRRDAAVFKHHKRTISTFWHC